MNSRFGLSKGRIGSETDATSLENPDSCSTKPKNDRRSVRFLGVGKSAIALILPGSTLMPPFSISYPTQVNLRRAKINFLALRVTRASRAACSNLQMPDTWPVKVRSNLRMSSTTRTAPWTPEKASSIRRLYSSLA